MNFPDFLACWCCSFLYFDFPRGRFFVPKLRINYWTPFGSSGTKGVFDDEDVKVPRDGAKPKRKA